MTTVWKVGLFAVVCAMAAGCAMGYDDEDAVADHVAELTAPGATPLPLCRWIEDQIRGKPVSIYPLRQNHEFVGVSDRAGPMCVDVAPQLVRVGLNPVADAGDPADDWEGTPLPADALIELAKEYAAQRGASPNR